MLQFTSIVGYTSCGPTYIESFFFTKFGQCINVLNYNLEYVIIFLYSHGMALLLLYSLFRRPVTQLVKRRITVREVAGSNPGRTKNQGLKITGKIMLAVCSTSVSV